MKVLPCCVNNVYSGQTFSASKAKARIITPSKFQTHSEQDYGKGMKQLSYIIGMSILGIASIILGTRGKVCSSVKL